MMLTGPALASSYDYRLVVLSVFIAIFASYAALDLAGRVTFYSGLTNRYQTQGLFNDAPA